MRTLPVTLSGSLSLITPLLLAIELWRDYGLKWGRFFMRFIRRCPVAVSYVLVSRRWATIGELAKSKLSKTAAVEALSFSTSLLLAENLVSKSTPMYFDASLLNG
jgi:hypothetical protein